MPDINELKRWLKIKDLTVGDFVKIVDEGQIREFEFEDKQTKTKKTGKSLEIGVSVNNSSRKGLTLNGVSIQAISEELGTDTKKWVGNEFVVDEMKTMSFGKITDVKFLKPVAWDEKK